MALPAIKSLILCDIDGTLLISKGVGKNAFERAFSEIFGANDSWQDLQPHGMTDPAIVRSICDRALGRSLSQSEEQELLERYVTYFELEIGRTTNFVVLPGVHELIAKLAREETVGLGIQTGNIEPVANLKLARAELSRYFEFGGYGSDSEERSELMQVAIERAQTMGISSFEDVVVIGDTPNDINAARAIGARVIAVATGIHSITDLKKLRPDLVLDDLSDTDEILGSILG